MTDSLHPPRSINWGALAVVLTIATMAVGLIAQWTAMAEAQRNAIARDVEQNRRDDEHESRIRALETNRAIEQQIAEFKVDVSQRLTAVETEVSGLRRDVRGRR